MTAVCFFLHVDVSGFDFAILNLNNIITYLVSIKRRKVQVSEDDDINGNGYHSFSMITDIIRDSSARLYVFSTLMGSSM